MWNIPNIRPEWVQDSVEAGERLPLHPYMIGSAETRMFQGVVAYVDPSVSGPDKARLWAMVSWHGGKVAAAASCPGISVVVTVIPGASEGETPRVLPHWVTESVRSRVKLPEKDFCPNCFKIETVAAANNNDSPVARNFKRKLSFEDDEATEDFQDFFSCNSSVSSPSGGSDLNSNVKKIAHSPRPRPLKKLRL